MKNNKNIKQIIMLGVASILCLLGVSCNDLDVPPRNVVSDQEIFGFENGITAYIAQMYSELPIEQFHGGNLRAASTMNFSGEIITNSAADGGQYGGTVGGNTFHTVGDPNWRGNVWDYGRIRSINYFLENLPKYENMYTQAQVNMWKAEAYFMRAFRYFDMAKRWGGVPIIDYVTNYPEQSIEELKVSRAKEAEVYDFVLKDLDEAINLFSDDPTTRIKGRANKWVAQAFKARAALHAGSIARYGHRYSAGHMYMDGLCGVPENRAAEFFEIAYAAADSVVKSGHYDLYKAKWAADPESQEENFVQIFLDHNNTIETMFAVYYVAVPKNNAHMFDTNNRPSQVNGADYNGKASPTVEMVERFEYANGNPFRLNELLTGKNDSPKFYKSPLDIFEGVEPRLRASIILPNSVWMNEEIEIRYGVVSRNGTLTTTESATQYAYDDNGDSILVQGKSGIGAASRTCTGFYVRKFQDPTLDKTLVMNHIHGSTTPWPEIRYAEVLLILAEAAVELGSSDKVAEAAKHIDAIRERAGAFNRNYTANTNNLTIDAVRNERRRELFFENKTMWDLIRWRVAHEEINSKQWNVLYPIYFWDGEGDRHYYMKRDSLGDNFRKTFNPRYYYQDIPGGNRNENLAGNPSGNY
jgi:hypothetical protein